jgi:hypothetical protein
MYCPFTKNGTSEGCVNGQYQVTSFDCRTGDYYYIFSNQCVWCNDEERRATILNQIKINASNGSKVDQEALYHINLEVQPEG